MDAHKTLYIANPSGWTTVSYAFLVILHSRITWLMSLKTNRLNMHEIILDTTELYAILWINTHYLLTPRCRVLLEKLTGLQLVKKFPTFHGTRRFITALTSVHHLSLSWASPIQSIYPHPTSWRSTLILSTHLHLCLPSGLFPSGFPTKTLYTPLLTHTRQTHIKF